jgi:hypothetical protein
MAIYQGQTTSFKQELYEAVHDFLTDTFNIALYTNAASLGADTTVYTAVGEAAGTGYSAGGQVLTGVTVASANGVAYVNFNSVTWNPADFTCRGALIYNASKSNKAVAVLDFGVDKTATISFTVQMPVNGPSTALIRSA